MAAIIAHRSANPRFNLATDRASVEAELDFQNAQRVKSVRGAESYLLEDPGPAPSFQHPRSQTKLQAAVGAAGKLREGAKLLVDWLGEGGQPVSIEIAGARSAVCAVCPKNSVGEFSRWFQIPVAQAIKKTLELRKDLNLSTPFDDKLGVCEVCLCSNKLKPWVPAEYLKAHTSAALLAEFPSNCWVPKEFQA